MSMLRWLLLPLVGTVLLSQSYIDLELRQQLGSWTMNAPLSDLAALCVLPIAMVGGLRHRPLPLPGVLGYALLLVAGVLSLLNTADLSVSAHFLLRKPLFMYLAYGLGMSWAIRQLPRRWTLGLFQTWALTTALVSILTSVSRIVGGEGLWFTSILGLTPNHKTLAVSLAGGLPLLIAILDRRWHGRVVVALVVLALLASASKTAWLMAFLGVSLFWPSQRPLGWRWQVLPVAGLLFALAYYAPLLLNSRAMLDAARSRHSLNRRALLMAEQHPLLGSGAGMSIHIEQVTFPDYRVNGVDAHGVIQKVGGELGALGLLGYGWFSLSTFAALRRRWEEEGNLLSGPTYGALASWGVGTAGLLLSTETFTQTWWVPLSVSWGLAHHPERDEGAPCAS